MLGACDLWWSTNSSWSSAFYRFMTSCCSCSPPLTDRSLTPALLSVAVYLSQLRALRSLDRDRLDRLRTTMASLRPGTAKDQELQVRSSAR